MEKPDSTFPADLQLVPWDPEVHAPCIGLINPKSGPRKGAPILEVCKRTDYYKDRVFDIMDVFKASMESSKRAERYGEDFKNFRAMLNDAKAKSVEKNDPKFRPRLLCGGGDGTASFALTIFFRIVQPDPDGGFPDTGNGFNWTDEELKLYFPAIIQMPLGTGNDLGRALGWGAKYPGYGLCGGASARGKRLRDWMDMAIRITTPIVNFDVWGLMPPPGQEEMGVKVCQLAVVKKVDGKKQCVMHEAAPVAPFLVFLYLSFGFIAHVASRFEPKRTKSQIQNKIVMGIKTAEILLGFRAVQLKRGMEGMTIENVPGEPDEKNGTNRYFPPRNGRKGGSYFDVGLMNANSFVGGQLHGRDRASCTQRWCSCSGSRADVDPTDGKADFFRERLVPSILKTGNRLQTDKKPGGTFKYEAAKGQGQFFQFDGEGRFAFSPSGDEWNISVTCALTVPMVVPKGFKKHNEAPIEFKFCGSTPEEVARIKARMSKWASGALVKELNATVEEMKQVGIPVQGEQYPEDNEPVRETPKTPKEEPKATGSTENSNPMGGTSL